jgi:hypothetical protein
MKSTDNTLEEEEILLFAIRQLVFECNKESDSNVSSVAKSILLEQKLAEYSQLCRKNKKP